MDEPSPAEALRLSAWLVEAGASYTPSRRVAREEDEFARMLRAAKAEAWDEGHSWGWSDAQDAHDVRQEVGREEWVHKTPNPYKEEESDD